MKLPNCAECGNNKEVVTVEGLADTDDGVLYRVCCRACGGDWMWEHKFGDSELYSLRSELAARGDILNRAVRHKETLFPDVVGNGWIDAIEIMAHEIPTLRGRLAAKERELEVTRLAHKATDKDRQAALDMLDAAGVWTGMDLLVHDRVASLIRDWQEQQRKIVTLQGEIGHIKTHETP